MKSLDVLVLSGLALAAVYPMFINGVTAVINRVVDITPTTPDAPPQPKAADASKWRQRWVNALIGLLDELHDRPDGLPSEPAETLCRELTWQILGGQPDKADRQVKK